MGSFLLSAVQWPKFDIEIPPMPEELTSSLPTVLIIGVLIAAVVLYAKALTKVQMGEMIVYRDWGDFGKAALWIIAIPLGLCWFCDDGAGNKALGAITVIVGCLSFIHTCVGAFKYNTGSDRWLALYARFAVILMLVFALGKLNEKYQQYRRHEVGFITGILIPTLIFAWVFKSLIKPMIGTQYYSARRMVGW